jgi:hypothetical protein
MSLLQCTRRAPSTKVAQKENPSQAYHSVLAKLQALKRKSPAELFAQRCVYAQFSSLSVCTKKVAAEQFGLLWFTTVSQLSSLLRKKPSSRAVCPDICLLQCRSRIVCTAKKCSWAVCTRVNCLQCSSRAVCKERTIRAVCAEMSLQQCTSQAVCIERLKEKSGSLAVCTDMS